MTKITSITLLVQTMDKPDAGADGPLYLGICGREFSVDSPGEDFERGDPGAYVFGAHATVSNAANNDPRSPQLYDEDLALYPVYLRWANLSDHWMLQRADVLINGVIHPRYSTASRIPSDVGIWLGRSCGLTLHLPRH